MQTFLYMNSPREWERVCVGVGVGVGVGAGMKLWEKRQVT